MTGKILDAAKSELRIVYFPHAFVGLDDNPRYPKEVNGFGYLEAVRRVFGTDIK
jgi:hypothetical protein